MGLFSKRRNQKQIHKLVSEVYNSNLERNNSETSHATAELLRNAGLSQQQTTAALHYMQSGKANEFVDTVITDDQIDALVQQYAKQGTALYNILKSALCSLEQTVPQSSGNSLLDYLRYDLHCYLTCLMAFSLSLNDQNVAVINQLFASDQQSLSVSYFMDMARKLGVDDVLTYQRMTDKVTANIESFTSRGAYTVTVLQRYPQSKERNVCLVYFAMMLEMIAVVMELLCHKTPQFYTTLNNYLLQQFQSIGNKLPPQSKERETLETQCVGYLKIVNKKMQELNQ